MPDGILIIDKPENFTSHDVVARLRRILKTKRIGHTGTLDPFATGVLVMLVGKATRLAQFLDKDAKEYEAIVRFGFETDTGDRTGATKSDSRFQIPDSRLEISDEELEKALADFRRDIWQTPPMYSAKKIAGKKLYELARKGVEIEREPVKVTINKLEIIESPKLKKSLSNESRTIVEESEISNLESEISNLESEIWNLESKIRVSCSAGTYVRTLAEDIGRRVGTGAHLAELRRTRAGKFDLSKALTIEELETIVEAGKLDEYLVSMNEAVSHLPEISLNESEIKDTQHGKQLKIETENLADNQLVRMIDAAENLIAVGFYLEHEKAVQPKLVLI